MDASYSELRDEEKVHIDDRGFITVLNNWKNIARWRHCRPRNAKFVNRLHQIFTSTENTSA